MIFISTASSSMRLCLNISRRKRLTRLRTTAQPIFLLTVMPNRAIEQVFSRQITRKPFTVVLCWAFESWRNSVRFLNRASFGNLWAQNTNITSEYLLGCNSYRQVLTAFCSSALYDKSTVFSGHLHQKTMGAFTGCIAGLKCSFHGSSPLLNFFAGK